MLNDFLKNSAIYGIGKVIALLIGFCTIPIITNTLTPSEYGVFDLLNLCLIMLNLSVALEVSQAIARYIGDIQDRDEKKIYVSTAYIFSFVMYGITGGLVYFFKNPLAELIFGDTIYASTILYLVPWLFLHGTNTFISNQFRWENKPKNQTILQIIMASSLLFFVALLLLFYKNETPLVSLIQAYLLSQITTLIFGVVFIIRHKIMGVSFSKNKLKTMLLFSSPLVISSLAVFAQNYIDRIMISQMLNFNELGIYSLAFKVASLLAVISGIFQLSAVPLIYKHHTDKDASQNFSDTANIYLFFILSCLVGISFFSAEIFYLFIDDSYQSALKIIPWLLFAIAFQTFQTFAPGLAIAKKTSYIAYINITGMGLNFILNLIFIGLYGLVGAAIATTLSAIIIALLNIIISQKYYYIQYRYKPILITVLITLACVMSISWLGFGVSISSFVIKSLCIVGIILIFGYLLFSGDTKQKLYNAYKKLI